MGDIRNALLAVAMVLSFVNMAMAGCCDQLSAIGFTSSLPVIVIDTWGNGIPDEPKTDGSMCTCAPQGNYEGRIRIEIRGSTSARDFKKKSYALQTSDEQGNDLKTDLLGFPLDSDWVLYGPELDASLGARNYLAMDIARQTGRYASRTEYCEVFVVSDGGQLQQYHYNGVYVLMEKVKKGVDRVNILKIGDDLSGGFIWKHDNNNMDDGDKYFKLDTSQLDMIVTYPKKDKVTEEQMGALKSFLDAFESELYGRRNYWQYIDEGAFIDYFLMTEITKNPDGYRGSTYMHKDKDGPIHMGPAWDYNEAFGQCCGYPIKGYSNSGESSGTSGGSAISTNGWRFNICEEPHRCQVDTQDGVSQWYRIMWEDEGFRSRVAARWRGLRYEYITDDRVQMVLSTARSVLNDAVGRNHDRWGMNPYDTWSAEMNHMESWTIGRLQWIDSQLSQEVPPIHPTEADSVPPTSIPRRLGPPDVATGDTDLQFHGASVPQGGPGFQSQQQGLRIGGGALAQLGFNLLTG